MGTALTGLLQGFSETHLKLLEYDEKRKKEQAELDFKKQDLDLRRQILKGEEAARTLRMQKDNFELQLHKRNLLQELAGENAVQQANQPGPPPGGTEAYLRDYGRQQATPAVPGLAATIPPAPEGMPYGTRAPLMAELAPETPAPAGTTYERMAPRPVLPVPADWRTSAPPSVPASPQPATGKVPSWATVQPTPEVLTAAQRASAAAGMPTAQLLGLWAVESALDPSATGPMTRFGWQAKGLGQLSPDTGKRFGVTDPYDLNQNAKGSALAWKEALQKAGGDPRVAYQRYYNPGASNADTDRVMLSIARFQQATPDPSQMVAGPGAPLAASPRPGVPASPSPAAATPLARQPAVVPPSPELERINTSIADWEGKKQRLDAIVAASPGLGRTKDVKEAYERYDKDLTRLRTERTALTKEQSPGDVFKAILLKNKGDLDKTIAEYQRLQIQQKSAEGSSGVEARLKAEQEQRRGQTLQEAWKHESSLFVDTQTALPTDPTQRYSDVEQAQRQGAVKRITPKQQERLELVQEALPIIQRINDYTQLIYGPGGALASLTPEERQKLEVGGKAAYDAFVQANPVLSAAQRYVDSHSEALARAIGGLRGAGTEGDVARAKAGFAQFQAAFTFSLWPPKVGLTLPDTRGTALRLMSDYNNTLNAVTGQIVGNPQFEHPGLPRYAFPEDNPQTRSGPTQRPEAPATLPPPAVGLNPRLSPAPDTGPAAQRPTPTTSATGVQGDDGTLGAFTPEQITQLSREDFERRFSATARAELTPAQRGIAEARWRSRR